MLRKSITSIAKRPPKFISRPITVSTPKSSIILRKRQSHPNNLTFQPSSYFSTSPPPPKKDETQDSLRDAINRMKSDQNTNNNDQRSEQEQNEESSTSTSSSSSSTHDVLLKLRDYLDSFREGVSKTWQELLDSGKPKGINKKIGGAADGTTTGKKEKYDGAVALVVIDESEHLGAWEKMQRRLSEAPMIQDILGKSQELFEKSGAKQAKEKIDDIHHDAKEAWETSQNPWVYRVSSVYDTLTAESEFATAVRQLRVLDPEFTLEGFKHDVVEHTLPQIMKSFLQGKIDELEPWLGEGVYRRLSAEIAVRDKEGIQLDDNVLSIFNADILEAPTDKVNKNEPILLMHFMCQQINCARDKKGEVVEGREDDIRAHSYLVCFQREYDEGDGSLNWKIVDFRPNGAIAWI